MTLKDKLPRSVDAHMLLNKSKDITPERMKKKQHPVVDVTGDGNKSPIL